MSHQSSPSLQNSSTTPSPSPNQYLFPTTPQLPHKPQTRITSTSSLLPLVSSPSASHKYSKVGAPTTTTTSDEKTSSRKNLDTTLKTTIRHLRLFTRLLSLLLSAASLALMIQTMHTFLTTRNTYINNRTAWHKDTKSWPTTLNLALSAISTLLNALICAAYLRSVRAANRLSSISSWWAGAIMLANMSYWLAGAIVYRVEKDKNGVSNDLWGWSCSDAAKKIQAQFSKQVDFDKECGVQTGSWVLGIAEAAVEVLALGILALAAYRARNKRNLRKGDGLEDVRSGEDKAVGWTA